VLAIFKSVSRTPKKRIMIVVNTCRASGIENPPTIEAVTTDLTSGAPLTDAIIEISMNLSLVAILSGLTFEFSMKLNKCSGECGKNRQ
jgi:hypothetical protein